MDDYVAVSKQEGANVLFSDMLPTLLKASQHDGKFWGLPYSYNVATAASLALYEYCRQFPSG